MDQNHEHFNPYSFANIEALGDTRCDDGPVGQLLLFIFGPPIPSYKDNERYVEPPNREDDEA